MVDAYIKLFYVDTYDNSWYLFEAICKMAELFDEFYVEPKSKR